METGTRVKVRRGIPSEYCGHTGTIIDRIDYAGFESVLRILLDGRGKVIHELISSVEPLREE